MYDVTISRLAVAAMKQLPQEIISAIQANALFSKQEEKTLSTIGASQEPTLETFTTLIEQHPDVFLPARTSQSLQQHWQLMKQYHLLPDQSVHGVIIKVSKLTSLLSFFCFK